jgi:hypothetical protein
LERARAEGGLGICFEIVQVHGVDSCPTCQVLHAHAQLTTPMGDAARQIAGEGGSRTLRPHGAVGRATRLLVCHDFILTFEVPRY